MRINITNTTINLLQFGEKHMIFSEREDASHAKFYNCKYLNNLISNRGGSGNEIRHRITERKLAIWKKKKIRYLEKGK